MLGIALIIATIPSMTSRAEAYTLSGCKYNTTSIKYYYDNFVSARGKSFIGQGAAAWSGVHASLAFGNPYKVYTTEGTVSGVSWDGMTSISCSGGITTSAALTWNMSATATWNSDGALKSVSMHEFGHVFGLNENGTTKTIMNAHTWGTNSRWGTYALSSPQTDDKNGVNYLY